MKNIVTIRNNDWEHLKKYFNIPHPNRKIDFEKVELKHEVIVPKDFEFVVSQSDMFTSVEEKLEMNIEAQFLHLKTQENFLKKR